MGNEHKKGRANPNKAGMYFSLAVCVIALAIGSYSAVNRKSELYESGVTTTESVVEIRKNQTDVTKTAAENTTVQTTQTTEKEVETKSTEIPSETNTHVVANHFVMPLGGTVKKEFSSESLQYSETYGDWRIHNGIDIAAKKGTEVCSAGKGKVKKVYDDSVLGKTVVIDHGNGIECYYCGVKSVSVTKGDVVEIGQRIGVVGSIPSEVADETHLHFMVLKEGKEVDPMKELELEDN